MNLMEQDDREDEQTPEQKSSKNPLTLILLVIIAILLLIILALFLILPAGKSTSATNDSEDLQQSITDYASEQKQNDHVTDIPDTASSVQKAIIVDSSKVPMEEKKDALESSEDTSTAVSDTIDKTAIVVDNEDESDISYTKEFILKEMMPYFAENNLEAIWDLAHLKRYVKLSEGLKNTDTYYYQGDVDQNGLPDGTGLAIYENNTYYYGSWSHGMRDGDGRWCRFYINASEQTTKNKKYQAHSYAGQWSNDLPNGEGAEHYDVDISKLESRERILQNVIGNFTDGLYDGEMYANTVDYVGNVEEWNSIANNGVFEFWQDMSSDGECYVWQKREDTREETTIYMVIDKAENKNQGIRELLNFSPEK